jgi:Na+-translocating ferredoxin:NAD+ oxidoreductase subunit D
MMEKTNNFMENAFSQNENKEENPQESKPVENLPPQQSAEDEKQKKIEEAKKAAAARKAAGGSSEEKKASPKKSPVEIPAEQYLVSSSPHIVGKVTTSKIMWTVNICLAPVALVSTYIFGYKVLLLVFMALLGAVGGEYLWQKLSRQKITIADGSAFVTGLLLAYNLSILTEWWVALIGGLFASVIVKQLFGGLGMNIFNPALAARSFLLASFPVQLTTWGEPITAWMFQPTMTTATPLDLLRRAPGNPELVERFTELFPQFSDMAYRLLLGVRGGCIGETSTLLLILGALYLIYKKYIEWWIPATYIATTALFMVIFGGGRGILDGAFMTAFFHIFAGGLILGAFYMATDYGTIPSTTKGRVIFAFGCGILTGVIRMWGGYPEGVSYSILIMNAFTPLIDDKTRTKIYGAKKEIKTA